MISDRDKIIKKLLQSHWGGDFELKKMEGGMVVRSPYPLLIKTENNERYVFRELGGNLTQARYVVELLMVLHQNNVPVAKCFPINSKNDLKLLDNDPDSYIGTHQFPEISKYYFIQEFLPQGVFLDRDTRINPQSEYFQDVYNYYEEVGVLAAKIQNATEHWIPQYQHKYITRREIAQKIKNSFEDQLSLLLLSINEVNEPNKSQIYFKKEYENIRLCFANTLNQFISLWEQNSSILESDRHIHNDLHLGNVLFDNQKIVGVIDFGQAQMDSRIVEISNSLLGLSSPKTISTQTIFDIPSIEKSFRSYINGFQKESKHKYSNNEIIMAWEVLRLRLLEYLYQNQLGIGRTTSAFDCSDREEALRNSYKVVLEFPLQPPERMQFFPKLFIAFIVTLFLAKEKDCESFEREKVNALQNNLLIN